MKCGDLAPFTAHSHHISKTDASAPVLSFNKYSYLYYKYFDQYITRNVGLLSVLNFCEVPREMPPLSLQIAPGIPY